MSESEFIVRLATVDDAAIIAWHRARMWQDMGEVPVDLFEPLRTKVEPYLREALASRDYLAWLSSPTVSPETIVAGAGVHLRTIMPYPLRNSGDSVRIAEGQHGVVLNVFTEPEWRRRGLAALLMRRIIDWARQQRLDGLTLHASDAGRALYEKMGFLATNEMRFATD